MTYGSMLADTLQSSTAGTAPVFKDGNSVETGQLCRAWINYKGTATVSIRASFNISSVTVNGTGDYTLNFTNAFADANYCSVTGYGDPASSGSTFIRLEQASCTTTTARITTTSTSAVQDVGRICFAVYR